MHKTCVSFDSDVNSSDKETIIMQDILYNMKLTLCCPQAEGDLS